MLRTRVANTKISFGLDSTCNRSHGLPLSLSASLTITPRRCDKIKEYIKIPRNVMTHINVVTIKVPTPVYTKFIVLSFVVCPADFSVTVNQKYVSYYILNPIKCVKIKKKGKYESDSVKKNKDYQLYSSSSSSQHYNISTII